MSMPPPDPNHRWQPPYGPPPPPSSGSSTGVVVALAFAGLALYSVVNVIVGFFVFFAAAMGSNGSNILPVAVGTAVLALVGLGAGIALVIIRKPWTRGLGLGLMIGWALWSILSAGICTGLNPGLYA